MSRPASEIESTNKTSDTLITSVFSNKRKIRSPTPVLPKGLYFNKRIKMDGLRFLSKLDEASIPVAFFDPQYHGVLDKLSYGNEGKSRGKARANLPQMSEKTIAQFVQGLNKMLVGSGHLFLWMDKFHWCNGFLDWLDSTAWKAQAIDDLEKRTKIDMSEKR